MSNPSQPSLLFLNRCYWPDSEATGQLLTDLCESLADEFHVQVVCGQPNSPTTSEFTAQGIEIRGGVTIHRLNHTRFAKRMPAGRVINLVSFANATARYLRRTRLAADIVISETDPFLLPIVAAKHSQRVDSRFVCYLQDIYPDVAEAIGKVRSGWLSSRIRDRLRQAYHQSDRLVVLGRCMQQRLESEPWSLDRNAFAVIPNWADTQTIGPQASQDNALRRREGLGDAFVVMHSGNMGLTQRLDVLIDATCSEHWPNHAILLLVGDGAARAELQRRAAEARSERVRFLPYQPRNELAISLSAADLHVVSMHERITGCLCPSKLYGILAAGRPLLAIASETTDLIRIVEEHQVGWSCPPGDPERIARQVALAAASTSQLIAAGERARELACREYDRTVVVEQFKNLLNQLLNHASGFRPRLACDTLAV